MKDACIDFLKQIYKHVNVRKIKNKRIITIKRLGKLHVSRIIHIDRNNINIIHVLFFS